MRGMEQDARRAAALDYAGRLWSVVPVRPREKLPLVPWQELQTRRARTNEIKAWLARWPDANLGLVTGRISGIVVIDVDPRHGGAESLARLELANAPLPPTVEAVSGGGGRHLYFAAPASELRSRAGIAPGLDLRAEGALVVAPPSIHPSGGAYRWREGRDPATLAPAPLPDWLLSLLGGRGPRRGHPVAYWRELVAAGVGEGERNTTIASLAGHLLWHGVDPRVTMELLLAWNRVRCRPPLDDEEVADTVASITRLHQGGT
jgi:hypothetical protein